MGRRNLSSLPRLSAEEEEWLNRALIIQQEPMWRLHGLRMIRTCLPEKFEQTSELPALNVGCLISSFNYRLDISLMRRQFLLMLPN